MYLSLWNIAVDNCPFVDDKHDYLPIKNGDWVQQQEGSTG